jgi:hypothetical protein
MSEWGNYDARTIYGTSVNVTNGSTTVVGTGTLFTANLEIGDIVGIHSDLYTKNRVAAIANNTNITLADVFLGTSNTTLPISFVKLNEQPKYVYQNGGVNGESGYDAMQLTYGVDTTEIDIGGANVTSVSVTTAGTKYKEIPLITVSSGTLVANAAINTSGGVANVTITTTGGAYSTVPTLTVGNPYITFNGATGVTAAANTITYTAHLFATGDAAVYSNGGGTTVPGLTSGSTYYVIKIGANALALAASASDATANTQVDITSTGVGAAHTLTLTSGAATVAASLGIGTPTVSKGAHTGWIKKTVGTGGRSGRIQYETLVAIGSITTDAVDDKTFPDA